MLKRQLLTAIAEQLIPHNTEPCPYDPTCPYSGPGWCAAPAKEREARQQEVLEQTQEEHLFAYIDEDASPWPCACVSLGLGMSIEAALKELEEEDGGKAQMLDMLS